MAAYICHHNGWFFRWSTVTDSPTCFGLPRAEFDAYFRNHPFTTRMTNEKYEQEIVLAIVKGTNAKRYNNLADLIVANRAGYEESELNFDDLIRIWVIEKRRPEEGEGFTREAS